MKKPGESTLKWFVIPAIGGCLVLLVVAALNGISALNGVFDLDTQSEPSATKQSFDTDTHSEARLTKRSFDPALWREEVRPNEKDDWPSRRLMVDSLLASHLLDILNYEQVLALLGRPTRSYERSELVEINIGYYLGDPPSTASSVHSSVNLLNISFTSEGKVSEIWLSPS